MGVQILLVDMTDAPSSELTARLARCGYLVRAARTTDEAMTMLQERSPDAVLVRTASQRDTQIHRSLRALTSAPIIGICVRRDEALIVESLEAGADRALAEPLSRRELAARVGAALAQRHSAGAAPPEAETYRVGDLVVDPDAYLVTKAGRAVSLTPTEFRLLLALARRAGRVASHAELVSEVWGPTYPGGLENLRLYIGYLRRRLGDDRKPPALLLSHRGVGYQLGPCRSPAQREGI